MKRHLGKLEIESVREGEGRMPMQFAVPAITGDDLMEMKSWYWSEELSTDAQAAIFHIEVRSYLLRVDGLHVLIDTCCGNDKQRSVPWAHRLQSRWLQNLADAGCGPQDVDLVLCTHLHADHVGWNTRLEDAAGHSPGSVVVNAQRGGSRAIFMGDIIHHPIQLVRPDLAFFADENPIDACTTRQRLLARCAENRSIIFPAHFPDPPAGRVQRAERYFSYGFL